MAEYPIPVFHFSVEMGGDKINFSEVSGMNKELQVIEYRGGAQLEFSTIKMPGIEKRPDINFKKGMFAGDNKLYDWLNTVSMNTIERRDITISLLNENHEPVVTWKVRNAWPTKLDSPTLKGDGNEVAIESLTIAHEGISIENNG